MIQNLFQNRKRRIRKVSIDFNGLINLKTVGNDWMSECINLDNIKRLLLDNEYEEYKEEYKGY